MTHARLLPRLLTLLVASSLLLAAAQDAPQDPEARRIINIDYSGGNVTGNLRSGPLSYSHPDPEGIVATVSNLTIYGQNAGLRAPEGALIAQSEGEREATFDEGVRVVRGRLEATGPRLAYSEATGIGVMTGGNEVFVAPTEEGEEPVEITSDEVDFDVDSDMSTSRGNVQLINGRRSAEAEEIVFEEERNLARMRSEGQQVTVIRRGEEDEITITADVIRVLTEDDKLLATGNVTLVSGNTRSTGDTVYFDDAASRAEIIGSPARATNEAEGFTVSGARLEQLTDIDVVEVIDDTVPSEFDAEQFNLSNETQS